jgi:hypothetical protein
MRRLLRLLLACLLAIALPLQGVVALAAATPAPAPALHAAMSTMPDGTPCPHHHHAPGHAVDKAGCGACCGPVAAAQPVLDVVPVADVVAPFVRAAMAAPEPTFLTGGPERPPRARLA